MMIQNNINVTALDYSKVGINQIKKRSSVFNKYKNIKTKCHDVRLKFPFEKNSFDACFSHMLYCMALTKKELLFLSKELNRILKPGGLNIYTVRNFDDGDYKKGNFVVSQSFRLVNLFSSRMRNRELNDAYRNFLLVADAFDHSFVSPGEALTK